MQDMVFQFRDSYHGPKKVTAGVIAAETEKLRALGGLTATRLLDSARPDDAPLHPQFEWDDEAAAEQYRLEQARRLIRAVMVVHPTEGGTSQSESLYVHIPPPNTNEGKEGEYTLLHMAAENKDEYGRALAEVQRRLDSADRAFRELQRLSVGRNDGTEAIAIASQGFSTVREALELLRVA